MPRHLLRKSISSPSAPQAEKHFHFRNQQVIGSSPIAGSIEAVSIYKIALWLGDDVRVVQRHYAKLLPKDEDIERAFSAPTRSP